MTFNSNKDCSAAPTGGKLQISQKRILFCAQRQNFAVARRCVIQPISRDELSPKDVRPAALGYERAKGDVGYIRHWCHNKKRFLKLAPKRFHSAHASILGRNRETIFNASYEVSALIDRGLRMDAGDG